MSNEFKQGTLVKKGNYDLFTLAMPHYWESQKLLGKVAEQHLPSTSRTIKTLELGIGNGNTTPFVLGAHPCLKVVGVDHSASQLKDAAEKLKGYVIRHNIMFERDDLLHSLQEGKEILMDLIFSAYTLHNCTDEYRAAIFGEVYRNLAPERAFLLLDKVAPPNRRQHQAQLQWQLDQFKIFDAIGRPELRVEWDDHYRNVDTAPGRILYERTLLKQLSSAGFTNVKKIKRWHMDALYVAEKPKIA
jgi:ubiquinone/menaquinone biosynthesis C-methylase UbiE